MLGYTYLTNSILNVYYSIEFYRNKLNVPFKKKTNNIDLRIYSTPTLSKKLLPMCCIFHEVVQLSLATFSVIYNSEHIKMAYF